MAVAFPVGIGLALLIGVVVNYLAHGEVGECPALLGGGLLVTVAIILDAVAYRQSAGRPEHGPGGRKGLFSALVCGLRWAYFYRFVGAAMSKDFINIEPGKLSPYTAMFFFALGVLLSNYIFNTAIMLKPFTGTAHPDYRILPGPASGSRSGRRGGRRDLGCGYDVQFHRLRRAGSAISYGLGQGATLVAACWGVFIWKEFREAPPTGRLLLWWMFQNYIVGLALLICAGAG